MEVPTEGGRGFRIPAAAHPPPPRIRAKVRPPPLTYPGHPGVNPSALLRIPQSRPSKGTRRGAPGTCNRFLGGTRGKVELLQGCKKFPTLQRPAPRSGREIRWRLENPPPLPGSLTHRSSRLGPPALDGVSAAAAASQASLGLAPWGRLRLPLSPAARGVVTPPSLSATKGGAGKWLRACTLRSSSPSSACASSPRCCSAGRRRGESTSGAQGGSHRARGRRGRRERRTTPCGAG